MKNVGKALDKRTRDFGTKHAIQMVKHEDGVVNLMLGPRKTGNHACCAELGKDPLWIVTGEAPSPGNVESALAPYAERSCNGDEDFCIHVRESKLIAACEANRWTRPRYRRGAVKPSHRADLAFMLVGADND